ncbi:hypothetical protein [Pseudomonas moorei]|uniref:Lipoprotein n=1 Tax=Pseudomonas moorei TaxID=395599 RepID=A0A1H1CS61_9PSED|nr:hypothetical protein [Pseudomonas moorei]KAB0504688.1 hypothetical protein F7R06_13245 [Pseudomonas moorei]SDQ67012.1 hypothetical protein SAMN04490195_1358 [Pseudomonas moorei]
MKSFILFALIVFIAGCANHPGECALGTPRADCLPGTNGYAERQRRMKAAAEERSSKELADDQKCRSYGAIPGSDAYVSCRAQLEK